MLQLVAVRIETNGSEAPTAVVWRATPSSTALVTDTGLVLGLKLGSVTISATTGGVTAAVILRVTGQRAGGPTTDLSGKWMGRVRSTGCTHVAGPGPSPCAIGAEFPFELDMVQTAYDVNGTLRLELGPESASGNITGWVDYSENMYAEGRLVAAVPEIGTFEIVSWDFSSRSPYSTLTGGCELVQTFRNAFGNQVLKHVFTLVDVRR
jgi:hypothetical protein